MAKSPTARTLEYYRGYGVDIDVVERWVPGAQIRKDLFGFIDLVAILGEKTVGVQATSTGNIGARIKKILALPVARRWVEAPSRTLLVIGWKKYKESGSEGAFAGKYYRPTERVITLADFG